VTLVVDASVVVSALTDGGLTGTWAEVASTLRRAVAAGDISPDVASMAHADLLDLRTELFPYAPFAARAWELRPNVTPYDAWYVALAEYLGASVATLDLRLARATGPRCAFAVPPPAT
jgi:predicted nucleic acid-binding protein